MSNETKIIKVTVEDHKDLKILASKDGKSIKDYISKIVDDRQNGVYFDVEDFDYDMLEGVYLDIEKEMVIRVSRDKSLLDKSCFNYAEVSKGYESLLNG